MTGTRLGQVPIVARWMQKLAAADGAALDHKKNI